MAGKVRSFSTLVENQLPEFISSDYPNFIKFVQKYYEQLENPGQPLDLINHITKYQDIDTYEKKLLQENTTLVSVVETRNGSNIITEVVINLTDGSSFPEKNGYVMIADEVIFYQTREGNSLRNCYRNVSATTRLGDLYSESDYKNVPYSEVGAGSSGQTVSGPIYVAGTLVHNISNLFLYAFVRNFESQYLTSFPEESLKPSVDKKTLIKNIKKFYQSKGTDQSIKFIFNSIVSTEVDDVPSVYYPKDYTFKASNGEWINKYALKVKVLSGNVSNIIGQRIVQSPDDLDPYAIKSFAVVDNIIDLGNGFYEIILATESIVGEFKVAAETELTKTVSSADTNDNIIDVFSTAGWDSASGKILINTEQITYKSKNVNQFVIESRGSSPQSYPIGTKVYNYTAVESEYFDANGISQTVKLIVLGVLYNLNVTESLPYSASGDIVQESKTGFETRDPIVYDKFTGNTRWKINEALSNPSSSLIPTVYTSKITDLNSDVSAVYEDDQYYYITSSGFPSHDFGKTSWNRLLQDQKFLKIIKKNSSVSTDVTKTPTFDVGIAVNGIPFYGYKDYTKIGSVDNDVIFGGVTEITLTSKGKGYLDPPYVLIEEKIGVEAAKARAILAGEVVDQIIVDDGGTGYFPPEPTVTITSGRNGAAEAVVTLGKITSLKLTNPGEYYSTPPEVVIIDRLGKGKFARYQTTISNDGKITGFIKEDEGKFYTQENIEVKIVSVGDGATAVASVRRWKKNRFNIIKSNLDSSNGYFFENINPALGYGYSYVANPKSLRIAMGDNLESDGSTSTTLQHSKILGYAYDGNPIYGPYGYTNPLDKTTTITRMISSYELKNNRVDGPPVATYPLGYFAEDYRYNHRLGTLDENNGRFCVTPEYPSGVYAYFITVDAEDNPVFPYILGNNFYSVPVDSNYSKQISQNDLPKIVSRLRTSNIPNNGKEVLSLIEEINSGSVSSLDIFGSHDNFSVGNLVEVDNSGTSGSGIIAKVSSVQGKTVTSLENRQIKAVQLRIENTAYLFKDDILYQENTNASGQIIGDVFDSNNIVLRNVSGTFNLTDKLYSNIKVVNLIVDKSSNFTSQSILKLSNGKQVIISNVTNNNLNVSSNPFVNGEPIVFSNTFSGITSDTIYYVRNRTINSFQISTTPTGTVLTLTDNNTPTSIAVSEKARALVLETTEDKNNIKCKILQGEFIVDGNYFLTSSTRTDTVGVRISQVNKLSENIKIFILNDNIAIASTNTNHNLAEGDLVNVDIIPNDGTTTTTYYVRKRIYQKVQLKLPSFETTIADTGIGRLRVLNSGADYASGSSQTYTNVELIFSDQTKCRDSDGRIVGSSNSSAVLGNVGGSNNAKATVTVTSGLVSNVVITSKGIGYKKGDLVTFSNSSLQRLVSSTSTQFFIADVDHVGFSFSESVLKLNKVEGLSQNDLIKIGKEVLKVNSINSNSNTVTVTRAQESTTSIDHYNSQPVVLYKSKYNLSKGYEIGTTAESGIVQNYDPETQVLTIVYGLSTSLDTIQKVDLNYTFFDQSTPKKLVGVQKIIEEANYQFEFSKENTLSSNWVRNPVIDIQRYYKYKFDTSNETLIGSFLEFSPSGNYNILTLETFRSIPKPGSVGSFVEIKFGFGPFYQIQSGLPKEDIKYTNYYYFDKNNIINSDKSYLKTIEDPLQGLKTITYVTPSKFVYELSNIAPYDGTGTISYTTTSSSAIGRINSFLISNPGKEFKKLPIVIGVRPSASLECTAKVNWNTTTKTVDSVTVISPGKNYSNPKAILVSGDGSLAEFSVIKNSDGSINAVLVDNKGKNYTYEPQIKIIETDLSVYFSSETIGVPKNIKIINNGYNFNRDQSISKKYFSVQILVLKNFVKDAFFDGEEIVQYDNNTLVAKGTVSKEGWRVGSNILRLQSIEGIFRLDLPILGRARNNTANIVKSFSSVFTPQIKSYYDNLGYYTSDRSNIGSESQRIADSYFYQDYSYTIKSRTPTDIWRNLIKKTTHPAGFKVFGEVEINTKGSAEFKPNPVNTSKVSFVQLWDPQKNRVSVESTRRVITATTVKVKDVNEVRGKGSAYVAPFDTTETISYEFYLDPAFDGYIDEKGNRSGTKSFNMKIKGSNSLLNVSNVNNLFITLDGILQEPGKSYNISDSTITFNEAPLGRRFSEGSYGNDSLTAKNPISFYKIKFKSTLSQLDLSYFVVGQEFTTNTSTRQFLLYKNGGIIASELSGTYKVVDKGVEGSFYNVVSFTNNVGNNTCTIVLSDVTGLSVNSAGLAISGNGIPENSGLQGIDLANKIITISGTVTSSTIGTVIIGNRYITAEPKGKLLPVLSSVYSENILNGTLPFTSSITVDGYNVATNAYFIDYAIRSYVVGVDTPSQDFVGRLIKFKDSTLNSQNFKKIKDISSQFDNIKTSFKLYYEDNTPVELPSTDNLIVSIDGVIQRSGTTPLLPKDRAYYIKRTTVPNEIVFLEAPRKFEELSSNDVFNKSKQSFFAYNVGAYERLSIDEQYIDDEFTGPFTLRSAVTGKTVSVDDDRNVLVFIEEVLQKRLRSYVIRGSNISFIEPLRSGQKINIIYLYGRNTIKYLTMFDFDHNDYLNRLELEVNYNPGTKQFTNIVCYQGNTYETNTANGIIKKYDAKETPLNVSSITASGTTITVTTANPHGLRAGQEIRVFGSADKDFNTNAGFIMPFDLTTNSFKYEVPFAPLSASTTATIVYITTTFTLETQNKIFVKTKDLYCIDGRADGLGDLVIPAAAINAIGQALSVTGGNVYFEETEETLDILRKTTTGWLIGSSLQPNYWNALNPDDQIKIDGEDEYRTILSIPSEVIKTEYRENADVTTGYLGKISTTNYNGIQLGEGLDIIANVDTDSASPTYGQVTSLTWNKKDYDRYQSRQILPRPAGYGYEDAPRLNFVPQALKDEGGSVIAPAAGGGARGYVVVHNGEPIDVVLTDVGSGYKCPPKVYITRGYYVKKSKKNSHHRIVTNFFTPLIESSRLIISSGSLLSTEPEPPVIYIESFDLARLTKSDIVITATISTGGKSSLPSVQPRLTHDIIIEPGPLKITSLSALSILVYSSSAPPLEQVFADSRVSIKDTTREIVADVRSFLKLIQSPTYAALHDTGAYLQSPLSLTDLIVYIPDTSKFTVSGRLMIDGEIIRYDNKLSDRFIGITRGVDGTSVTSHDAGAFVRQYRENVSIISAGVSGAAGISEIISIGSISSGSASVADIISVVQQTTNPNIVSIGTQVDIIVQDTALCNSVVSVVNSGLVGYFEQTMIQLTSIESLFTDNVTSYYQQITNPNIVSVGEEVYGLVEQKVYCNSVNTVLNNGFVAYVDETTISLSSATIAPGVIVSTIQEIISSTISNITIEKTKSFRSGFIDFFEETIVIDGNVFTRSGTIIVLDPVITVIGLRSGGTIDVENRSIVNDGDFISYLRGSVGNNIYTLESWKYMDTGFSNVSGVSIEEFELSYGPVSLQNFDYLNESSYLDTGVYFNAGYPSIQNPVTSSLAFGTLSSTIPVPSTTYFPTSGYLLTNSNTIIQYTGKTSSSFTGCSLVSGSNSSLVGSYVNFDGNGDYLNVASSSNLSYGTSDFTIEFWIKPSVLSGTQVVFDQRTVATDVAIYMEINVSGNIRLFVNGAYRLTSTVATTTSDWRHVALSRQSGVTRLFVNGTLTPTTYADTNNYANKPLRIGGNFAGSSAFSGGIGSLRIVKGSALYTADYTPSISSGVNIAGTSLLTCQGPIIRDRSANNQTITVSGDTSTSSIGSTEIVPYSI